MISNVHQHRTTITPTDNGISVVLGSYQRFSFLKLTVNSIRDELKNWDVASEIIIVDGGSTDGTLKWLSKQKDIITIIQHNRGKWQGRELTHRSWGYFMNLGFKCAQGKYVCMLSDDCLIVPDAIRNGYDEFEQALAQKRKIGAVAFYWRNWPEMGKYQVGLTLGQKMFVNHGLYLKAALNDVNYIDEDSFAFYHADGDLCLKMWQAGYEVIDSKESFIEHFSHANSAVRKINSEKQKKDWDHYLKKWEGIFYNSEIKNIGGWVYSEKNPDERTVKRYKKFLAYSRLKKLLGIMKLWLTE